MKKAMKQLLQKGLSGILCAAMILTSLSIPEMTAYAAEPEITEETHNEGMANDEGAGAGVTDKASSNDDANSEAGGGDFTSDNDNAPNEAALGGGTDGTPNTDSDKKGDSENEYDSGNGSDSKSGSAGNVNEDIDAVDEDYNTIDAAEENATVTQGDTVTLNYYYGETGKTLGIYTWIWDAIQFPNGSTWSDGAWDLGGWSKDVCIMKESDEYAGWYTIELVIGDLSADYSDDGTIGFEIHGADDTTKALFKCGKDGENSTIYDQLISGDATSYAVKKVVENEVENWKCYADDAEMSIMRTVTLHVYSEDGVPALMTEAELKYIDETVDDAASREKTLDPSFVNSYEDNETTKYNYYYNMEEEDGQDNWYELTFIAPYQDVNWVYEIAQLHIYNGEGTPTQSSDYTRVAQFYSDAPNWSGVTDEQKDFTPVFKGNVYYKDGAFADSTDPSPAPTEDVTLGELRTLVTTAAKEKEYYYTDESWTDFSAKLEAAEGVVETLKSEDNTYVDSEGTTTIKAAYDNLNAAMKALVEEEVTTTITLNYYAGDTDGKNVGIYQWGNNVITSTVTTTWDFWERTTYEMSPAGYSGWYTIPLTFTGKRSTDTNFQVVVKGGDSALFMCKNTTDGTNNGDIFYKLFFDPASDGKTFAVRGFEIENEGEDGSKKTSTVFKLYEDDDVEAAMRNVTLYVHSSDNKVPAIGSASKLSALNAAGEFEEITESSSDNDTYFYNMKADTANDGWYYLTFSAPTPATDSGEICGLYLPSDDSSSYELVKKFTNTTPTVESEVDFSPVFEGNVYYNNGKFYASMDLAEGITFQMLKDLLESEKVQALIDAGEDGYSSGWDAFKSAIDAAEAICNADPTPDEDYTSEAITAAYEDLNNAIKGLVAVIPSNTIMLYYYDATASAGDELGLYFWDGDTSSSTAQQTNGDDATDPWAIWSKPTYALTPMSGYKGWYRIPLTLVAEGGAGFEIHKRTETGTSGLFTASLKNAGSEIYAQLTSGDAAKYAVKGNNCYAGDDVDSIMRNVTLYVYSKDGVPSIMSAAEMSYIDETDGNTKKLVANDTQSGDNDDGTKWYNYYYNMTPDTGNWYKITFTALNPEPDEESGAASKICDLLINNNWTKNFMNGAIATGREEWDVDFTPVFNGSIYYKDGAFTDSRAISLGELRELFESAKAMTQGSYTNESWTALQTAISEVEPTITSLQDKDGTYTDEDSEEENDTTVTDAYNTLSAAIDGLSLGEVKLYYYAGTGVTDVGLTTWTNGDQAMDVKADTTTDWHAYNSSSNVTYKFTRESYPGWYSISLEFKDGADTIDAGFSVHTWDGSTSDEVWQCSLKWKSTDIYAALISGSSSCYAVKGINLYEGEDVINALMRNATIYVYDSDGTPAIAAGSALSYVDDSDSTKKPLSESAQIEGSYYYDMQATADENWYTLTVSAPVTTDASNELVKLYSKSESGEYTLVKTWVEGTVASDAEVDYTPVFSGCVYYKNGKFYSSQPMSTEALLALIEQAEALIEEENVDPKYSKEEDNGKAEWDTFNSKLEAAKAVAEKTEPTDEEIITAYNDLDASMKALVMIPIESKTISVDRVALDDDFITGADLSSYLSLKESGTIFKDEDGKALSDAEFFKMLYDGGTNWVRIRVWNDPYNSSGNGYGGGNSDLNKAKIIGKLATDAGMRVLIDFHYSDFWADPSKQDAPKAWANLEIDDRAQKVKDFTKESLNELKAAGVDVGMVQVGNETNNAICGATDWADQVKIYNAGSKGVRESEFGENCLVAVHIADPSDNGFTTLAGNLAKDVDYDVFAASYYPFWHGTTDNLTKKLTAIAKDTGKKVMVAETSWVTTWNDGDGHGNTSPKTEGQTLDYPISVQGQANEIRDVVNAVNLVNEDSSVTGNPAIGVFYWEPAWISPYYVYNADGSIDQSLYKKNVDAWEKYGSGWASSYAMEYDPADAGLWYGGSAVDNQAWFDFDGKAYETTKIYKYIRNSAKASGRENEISTVEKDITLKTEVGKPIAWPTTVKVTFSDGTTSYDETSPLVSMSVKWDEEQKELVNSDKPGIYTVYGTVICTYSSGKDGVADKTETYDNIKLTVEVIATSNILINPGFETGSGTSAEAWETNLILPTGESTVRANGEDVRSGSRGMHFYSDEKMHFTVEQMIPQGNLGKGIYSFGGYIQGGGAGADDLQTLYVKVYGSNAELPKMTYKKTCSLNGFLNWVNPEITGIKVSTGDHLVVGMEIDTSVGGAWGTMDDMYLYGSYGINVNTAEHGVINVSSMEATSGDIVRIAAIPDNGYVLSSISVSGMKVSQNETGLKPTDLGETDAFLIDFVPEFEGQPNKITLEYDKWRTDAAATAEFKMPDGSVTIDAEFESVADFSSPVSLEDDNVIVAGFTKDTSSGQYICDTTQDYTGRPVVLDLDISYKGYNLTSADYSATFSKNKAVTTDSSMAEIKIKAKGRKFTGTRSLYFKIADTKVDISKGVKAQLNETPDVTTGKTAAYYYTGEEIEPTVKNLTDAGGTALKSKASADMTLVEGEDYEIYYQNNIKVGTAKMTIIAKSDSKNIRGSFTQTFKIAKRPINDSGITVSEPSGSIYTGSKITPNVTVKYGTKVLQKGKDYTITYKNNVNVSIGAADAKKPYIKITGKGSYTGSIDTYPSGSKKGGKITFEISPRNISDHGIKVTADDIIQGKPAKIAVKNGTKALVLNKQYKVMEIVRIKDENGESVTEDAVYTDGGTAKLKAKISTAGRYKVTIQGMGNYSGENKAEFTVTDKDHMISNMKIELPKKVVFTGSEIKFTTTGENAQLKVTPKNSTSALTEGNDYEVSYEDANGDKTNIKVGTAKVTITGKGLYAGNKTVTFKITKSPIVGTATDAADKTVVSWKPKKDTLLDNIRKDLTEGESLYLPYTGYKWTPEVDVTVDSRGATKTLTKGVDYTISFKNNLKAKDETTIIIKGKGNYSGTVKFEKAFTIKDVTLDDFVITINPVEYSGKAIKPAINFVYTKTGTSLDMKAGTAYSVKYKNNKNVASVESAEALRPIVTIKEKGMNALGTKKDLDVEFTITTGVITYASVNEVKMQTYKGKPVKPALTVKVNGKRLKAGKDYTVKYIGNSGPNDKATAQIIGIGNYSGTVNKNFVIK